MGLTYIEVTVANVKSPELNAKANFLVDSGAFYTVLPEELWKKLQIAPKGTAKIGLADGTESTRPHGVAQLTFLNEEIYSKVILGEPDDSLLLGALALEEAGLWLDPLKRRLIPAKITM